MLSSFLKSLINKLLPSLRNNNHCNEANSTSLGGGWHAVPGEGFNLTFADLHLPSLDFSNTRKLVLKNLSPRGEIGFNFPHHDILSALTVIAKEQHQIQATAAISDIRSQCNENEILRFTQDDKSAFKQKINVSVQYKEKIAC